MWFFGLIVVLLIGAVAVVASGRWGAMAPAYDDRPDLTVPARQALTAEDLETARFGVGLRGYRMDEVDTLLERVAREVAERDRRIADLERAVSPIIHGPEGAGFTSRSEYTPADFDDTGYTKPILVGGDFPPGQEEPPAPEPPAPEPAAPQEPTAHQDAAAHQEPAAPEGPAAHQEQPLRPEASAPAGAQAEAQVGSRPEADLQGEQLGQPHAVAGAEAPTAPEAPTTPEAPTAPEAPTPPQAPTAPEPPARPEEQVVGESGPTPHSDALAAPHAVTPPEAPASDDAADGVQGQGWFEEEAPSPLDGQQQPPVPLPPLLQELVHTHEEDEQEVTPWFQAKEPPPDHTATDPTPGNPDTPHNPGNADDPGNAGEPGSEGDTGDADGDEQPRGRHSAAPDVSAVQRPN